MNDNENGDSEFSLGSIACSGAVVVLALLRFTGVLSEYFNEMIPVWRKLPELIGIIAGGMFAFYLLCVLGMLIYSILLKNLYFVKKHPMLLKSIILILLTIVAASVISLF